MKDSNSYYLKRGITPDEAFILHQGNSSNLVNNLGEYFAEEVIESGFVDVTITSPPYADLKDYQNNNMKEGSAESGQIGFDQDYEDYLENLRSVFKQVYDITKDDGTLWVVVNTLKEDGRVVRLPTDIATICENLPNVEECTRCETVLKRERKSGLFRCPSCDEEYDPLGESWVLHDIVIWDKERARPYTGEKTFRNVFEYLLIFKKSSQSRLNFENIRIADPTKFAHWWVDWPERYHPRGMVPENIWQMVTPSQGKWGNLSINHPAPFPPELIERIVELTTKESGIVLDPFGGTGMTVAQASAMGRNALGFELVDEYVSNFPDLREEIKEIWENRKSDGETLEKKQERLSRVIWGLRQFVYARKMVLQLRRDFQTESVGQIGLNTLFVIQQSNLDQSQYIGQMNCKIQFVVDQETSESTIEEMSELINQYRTEDPWTSFELTVDTSISKVAELDRRKIESEILPGNRLYLYTGDRHYNFKRSITLEDWFKRIQNPGIWRSNHATEGYPPTVSNVPIQIERGDHSPTLIEDPLGEPPEADFSGEDTLGGEYKSTSLSDFS